MEARLVHRLRHHEAQAAQHFHADRNAFERRRPIRIVPLAGGKHRRHDHRAGVHRPTLERVVEILAVHRGAVDQRRAGGAERARMADRGARTIVVASRGRRADVVLVAREKPQADHVDRQVDALPPHGGGHVQRRDALGEPLGDGDLRKLAHVALKRTAPKPGRRLIAITTAKVMTSMMMPSTAIAPRSPDSLRSKISTEITLVSEVNRMMAADNSRITPTKMKHQVAITLVRNSGAVMWPSDCRRVAPRMRLASSRSPLTVRNADWSCW